MDTTVVGLSKFKWIMDDKSMIMVSHSLFSSASYCPRIWMQWGWSLWTTTSQFVSPNGMAKDMSNIWDPPFSYWRLSTLQSKIDAKSITTWEKKHCIQAGSRIFMKPCSFLVFDFHLPCHPCLPEVAMSLAERASLHAVSWMRSKKPTCEGWNRLEPLEPRLGGFREAIAQEMKALCWVKVSVHWGRGRGEGAEGAEGAEGDPEIGCFLKWNMMHHWIWGCMLVFRQTHMSKWVRTLKLLKSSNLLGDDPPPSLAGGLAIETASTASQSMVLYVPSMFQHWGMLLRLVSPLFWNNSFWWILRV